jgi:hypothetical protein
MMAWISALFGKTIEIQSAAKSGKPALPRSGDLDAALRYAHEIFHDGFGYYHVLVHQDPAGGEVELVPELIWLEARARALRSVTLYAYAARGWQLVASQCRVRGLDKTGSLLKAISLCEDALLLDPGDGDVRCRYAEILTYSPQVRNFALAAQVLTGIPESKRTPDIKRLVEDVDRRLGCVAVAREFDYAAFKLYPTGDFEHERKKCRALIRSLKSADDLDDLRATLDHLYRLAVLHRLGSHASHLKYRDAAASEEAACRARILAKDLSGFSYAGHGRIRTKEGLHFLSEKDYLVFEKVYGRVPKTFDPVQISDPSSVANASL